MKILKGYVRIIEINLRVLLSIIRGRGVYYIVKEAIEFGPTFCQDNISIGLRKAKK